MRSDLRKLFWSHRRGWTRRWVVEEAVDEACSRLVSERFHPEGPLQEVSPLVQPFLAEFESRIAYARLWLQAGEHRRAVHAVEGAEQALAGAQEMASAEEEWRRVRSSWRELSGSFGLGAFPHLATVRIADRSLEVAETFLQDGQARKARLVARQLRVLLDRLTRQEPDEARRSGLIRSLVKLRGAGGRSVEELSATVGRMVDAGLLELAQRLEEDWRAGESGGGDGLREETRGGLPAASTPLALPSPAGRFGKIEREASRLAGALAEIVAAEGSVAGEAAVATEMETEVE